MTKRTRPSHHALTRRALLKEAGALTGGLLAGHMLGSADAAGGSASADASALLDTLAAQHRAPVRAEDRPRVALAQADSYDPDLIRESVATMIEQLGGLDDIVHRGDQVAIKTNLTGGTNYNGVFGVPATEVHITHPAVTRALVEAVLDAGASKVFIVEGIYDKKSWSLWGNTDIAKEFDQVTLINLNDPDPYEGFVSMPVGDNWLVYNEVLMHSILSEVDAVMSLAKMKCHAIAGITLGMKNSFGLLPIGSYQLNNDDSYRTALHGSGSQAMVRVPSVVMDIVRARPIDFVLIDGVKTSEGSEGPWNDDFNQKAANVLVAGKSMVATDAVGAAVMGFDPAASSFAQSPFRYCLNHLQLAAALGLGTVTLDDIDIVGAALSDVQTRFRPYHATADDMVQRSDFPVPYPQPYGKV